MNFISGSLYRDTRNSDLIKIVPAADARCKILIDKLFNSGKQIKNYPIKLFFLENNNKKSDQVSNIDEILFSVPKKIIRKAVDRNKIKRRMKESFRLTRKKIIFSDRKELLIALVFVGKEKNSDYQIINNAITEGIKILENKY